VAVLATTYLYFDLSVRRQEVDAEEEAGAEDGEGSVGSGR